MARLETIPTASIIVPCYNHASELARCIASLGPQTIGSSVETVVVDSSPNHAAEKILESYNGVVFVKSATRLRPGAARNLGAEMAKGKYLIFIDADCTVEPRWLREAIGTLDRGYRIVGGSVSHGEPWHPLAIIDNLMQFLQFDPRRKSGPTQLLATCNFALRKADFKATGGFPELEHSAGEDVLFFADARTRWPGELYLHPAMRVRHFGRRSWSSFWSHQYSFGYIRALYALEIKRQHLRWGRFIWMTPVVAAKRLFYLLGHSTRYPVSFVYLLLLLPILVAGVSAWSFGFHQGCKERAARSALSALGGFNDKSVEAPSSRS